MENRLDTVTLECRVVGEHKSLVLALVGDEVEITVEPHDRDDDYGYSAFTVKAEELFRAIRTVMEYSKKQS